MKEKIDNLTKTELENLVQSMNEKKFRGRQLYKWIYQKGAVDFEQMTDIPKDLRKKLGETHSFTKLNIKHVAKSKLDGSMKTLFQLEDNNFIESVIMFDGDRVTGCISTQVGCKMNCKFCNTAKIGFIRNLSSGEIIRQITEMNKILLQQNKRLTNIVFMGMGEPLDNLTNLKKSLEIILDENGLNFSHRKVTVSTAGLMDKLFKITDFKINIAISLNASTDEQRNELMPINKKYNIKQIVETIKKLPIPKRKRVTIEYVLIKNFNDSEEDAKRLAELFKGIPIKVNLILYNETKDGHFTKPTLNSALNFQKTLINRGVGTFIRKSFGSDIEAACGQLYAKYLRGNKHVDKT